MMQSPFDIVDLIENNPLTALTSVYNNPILNKLQQKFTKFEQSFFVTLNYCNLNYNLDTDFVIDLDNIWKWLGFNQKCTAKTLLEKIFTLDVDYKYVFTQPIEPKTDKVRGGHNKGTIMLTIKTFKSFCVKSDTKKAHEIQEYYIHLKTILHEIVNEENDELKIQCEQVQTDECEQVQTDECEQNSIIYNEQVTNATKQNNIIQEILAGQKELIKLIQNQGICIQNLEKSNKEMSEKLNAMQTKTTTNFSQPLATLGPRLQQINPDTLTVIKVYESIAECIKEHNFKLKRPTIVKAIDENIVYNGYRWAFVDRNVDPTISTPIAPTKQTKQQNIGYIAKINEAKTEILNVYLDRKTAAIQNNYNSDSSLDVPVKNASITNGHYYMLYEKCTDELKTQFADIHGEPVLYKNGIGHYDSENQLITEYVCKYDCIKQLKMSDKTLAKALDKNVLYNNHYFRSIGSKIMI